MAKQDSYSGKDIQVLEGLDAVRKRPGMYIGGTGSSGLTHCVWEIFDNAVDEALAGHATKIELTIHADDSFSVLDNGRGIPVDIVPSVGVSALEVVLTKLHAGGKFGGSGYPKSGGLHGVGASVVNALSSRLDAHVYRDGKHFEMSFCRGVPGTFSSPGALSSFKAKAGVRTIGKIGKADPKSGTYIQFWPDRELFPSDAQVELESVVARVRQTAFLVPGLEIKVRDLRGAEKFEESFKFTGGIRDMAEFLSVGQSIAETVHFREDHSFVESVPMLNESGILETRDVERALSVDVAVMWSDGFDSNLKSFVNVVETPKGGTHVKGFERGILSAVRSGLDGTRLLKASDPPVVLDDVCEGLTAVVSVMFPEPQFEGQTKEVLGTPAVLKIVQDVTQRSISQWISGKRKSQARRVLEKIANASRARVAARSQREAVRRKSSLDVVSLPAKLVDCRSTNDLDSELFIVEGDSALGCFTADTKVRLADGTSKSFAELVADWGNGITHFGLAIDSVGNEVVRPLIEPRVTKTAGALVDVVVSGRVVTCTPDHLFMTLDGKFVPALQLKPGDYLKSISSIEELGSVVESVTPYRELALVYDLTVEGDHNFALDAGFFVHNSARLARNSENQALLPIRGKILNVQKANLTQMLANGECSAILQVIGTGTGKSFNIEDARYGRVILMTDADVDGAHIRVLLLTLFHKYMPGIITDGRLFAAMPPLYRVATPSGSQHVYAYTDTDLDGAIAHVKKAGRTENVRITRYKGLGEMDSDELWETTMDPQTRSLRKITLDDTSEASQMMELLMGDDVAPRRDWIISNSHI